jgi:hypothetical protein
LSSPSPNCLVGGLATPADVPASSTVTGGLASTAGAQFWSLTCINTDELNTAAAINATLSVNQGAKTFSFTAPGGLGSKVVLQSVVGITGLGLDANGIPNPAFTTTFAVNVPLGNGQRVWAVGETFEQNASFGNIVEVNAAIRTAAGGGGGCDLGTIYAPPLAANWTHRNFGSGTSVVDVGRPGFSAIYLSDYTTGTSNNVHGVELALPNTVGQPYSVTAGYWPNLLPDNTGGHNSTAGIYVTDGTKLITFQYVYVGSSMQMQVQTYNSATSINGAPTVNPQFNFGINARCWVKIQVTGGNRNFSFATDGADFIPASAYLSQADTVWINNAEIAAGAHVIANGSAGAGITVFSWHMTAP